MTKSFRLALVWLLLVIPIANDPAYADAASCENTFTDPLEFSPLLEENFAYEIQNYSYLTSHALKIFKPLIHRIAQQRCIDEGACTRQQMSEINREVIVSWGGKIDHARTFTVLSFVVVAGFTLSNYISQNIPENYQFFRDVLAFMNAMGASALIYRYSFPVIESLKKWSHKTEQTSLADPYDRNQSFAGVRYRTEELVGTIDAWGRSIILDVISFYTPRIMVILDAVKNKDLDRAALNFTHFAAAFKKQYPEVSPYNKDLAAVLRDLFGLNPADIPRLKERIFTMLPTVHLMVHETPLETKDLEFYYRPLFDKWLETSPPSSPPKPEAGDLEAGL